MRISDLMPQGTTGLSGALQSASPLLLAMGQGLSSGQGVNAFMPQGMAGMMALQERQKEKAANDKLDEMLSTFNVSPAERALLSTMDLSGKQQYLANLMQSRRKGGGGGSGIDPAMWQSIMGGDMAQPSATPSGAGMLSMGQPVTMGGQERGQLSFGLPEADTGAPLQGAAGMMGQSVPQQPAQPPQRPPMGSPASLSFGQMAQQPAQMPQTDPMAQIRQIEARMMQVSQLPPSKTTTAAMNALQARREILLAQAERNAPEQLPASFDVLRRRALAAGLVEGSPEYQQFMLQGGTGKGNGISMTMPDGTRVQVGGDPQSQRGGIDVSGPGYMLDTVNGILNDPALNSSTGLLEWKQAIPGTDAYRFGTRVKQLEGQAFLQAFESLKGGGQITEIEGQKATQAIARIDSGMRSEDFREAMAELKDILGRALQRPRGWVDTNAGRIATMSAEELGALDLRSLSAEERAAARQRLTDLLQQNQAGRN